MAKELLKDISIRNAKSTDKDIRLNDGNGLYLIVKSNSAKWWRFDYTFAQKRKTLSLGVYPETSLSDARRKAEDARSMIANGRNPSDARKEEKINQKITIENKNRIDSGLTIINSFEYIAREWGEKKVNDWKKKTIDLNEC